MFNYSRIKHFYFAARIYVQKNGSTLLSPLNQPHKNPTTPPPYPPPTPSTPPTPSNNYDQFVSTPVHSYLFWFIFFPPDCEFSRTELGLPEDWGRICG